MCNWHLDAFYFHTTSFKPKYNMLIDVLPVDIHFWKFKIVFISILHLSDFIVYLGFFLFLNFPFTFRKLCAIWYSMKCLLACQLFSWIRKFCDVWFVEIPEALWNFFVPKALAGENLAKVFDRLLRSRSL